MSSQLFAHSFRELRDSQDPGVLVFGRTPSGDPTAWRVVHIPKVLYVQIKRDEEKKLGLFQAELTERLSQLSNLKPDVIASQFHISGPEWRSIAPKVSSKRHQRVNNGFQDPATTWETRRPFSTTVTLRVLRVTYPWTFRINWTKTTNVVELEQFTQRIFTENLNLTQRVLLEKRIRGPAWIETIQATPASSEYVSPTGITQQVRKLRQKQMTSCHAEWIVQFEHLITCSSDQAIEPLQHASLSAVPLRVTTLSLGVARSVTSSEAERNNCLSMDAASSEATHIQPVTRVHTIAGLHQGLSFDDSVTLHNASAFLLSCTPEPTNTSSETTKTLNSTVSTMQVAREEDLYSALLQQLHETDIIVGYRLHEEILPLLYSKMSRTLFAQTFTRLETSSAIRNLPMQWTSWYDMEPALGGRLFCNLSSCVTDRVCASIEDHYNQQREVSASPGRIFHGELLFGALSDLDHTFANFSDDAQQIVQDVIQLDYIAQQTSIVPILFQRAKLVGARLATVFNRSKIAVNDEHLMTAFFNDGFILRECCLPPAGRRGTSTSIQRQQPGANNHGSAPDLTQTDNVEVAMDAVTQPKHGRFAGGRWIAATRGLHEYAFELDAFAFYATIFQALNICVSNAEHAEAVERQISNLDLNRLVNVAHDSQHRDAFATTPKEIARLTHVRCVLKSALKQCTNANERQMLEILMAATKISINSIYGCFGNENSRFYFPAISAAVAAYGRALHEEASELLTDKFSSEVRVVYGATDSLLLAATPQLTQQIQSQLTPDLQYRVLREASERCVDAINDRRPAIKWILEDLFSRVLLLESNRYVALSMPRGNENDIISFAKSFTFVGVDLHQGGMCRALLHLRRTMLTRMLLMIGPGDVTVSSNQTDSCLMTDTPLRRALKQDLCDFVTRVKREGCLIEDLVITNQLKKRLDQYDATATDPHVQVARLLVQFGINVSEKGSAIDYVMCKGDIMRFRERETIGVPYQLLREDDQHWFVVDMQWYLRNHIGREIDRLMRGFSLLTAREIELALAL